MKKLFKKNQFVVTFLAVLIAVAGYLNYANNLDKSKEVKQVDNNTYESVYSEDDLLTSDEDIESLDDEEETAEPGEAVLTNGTSLNSYMVQAKLNREQTRSKNKETLLEVINNNDVSAKEKKLSLIHI